MSSTDETDLAAVRALRREVRKFLADARASGAYSPRSDFWMSGIDPDFSRALAGRGWVGMTIPTQFGGHGRSALERFVVTEELLAGGAPVGAHWFADRQMAPSILRLGTDQQREKYLPGIARAERFFGIGMSEPDSGSDLASVRTRATLVDGDWVLTGAKIWTTAAHVATNLIVLVRTDPAAASRHSGLSQFIVDLPHPDIHIRPIVTMDGGHHFNEVVFDDARLPGSSLLGTRGNGWAQVTAELAHERSGPERLMSTVPLLVEWAAGLQAAATAEAASAAELGRLISRLTILRQLSFDVATRLNSGENPATDAALVKDLGTTFEADLVDTIRRTAGEEPDPTSEGFSSHLAAAVMASPAFTLRGGTNEILRTIVAREVTGS